MSYRSKYYISIALIGLGGIVIFKGFALIYSRLWVDKWLLIDIFVGVGIGMPGALAIKYYQFKSGSMIDPKKIEVETLANIARRARARTP